jgi:hypothetical protein
MNTSTSSYTPNSSISSYSKAIRGQKYASQSNMAVPASPQSQLHSTSEKLRTLSTASSSNSNSSFDLTNPSFASSRGGVFLDSSFEDKLATTGNIFQRREDWSILSRIPICKQNTIHIRLEDEGPYGNDETRCFVLSHLSSLGVREIPCVFCACQLVIYDRFPLVDGTLFTSPHAYDKRKSIAATIGNKQQYINGICLNCLLGENGHEIACRFCQKSMHMLSAYSIQLGTLYKYDLFAAFSCCPQRLTCVKCNHVIGDVNASQCFSQFSEERECPSCKTRAYHFIKPLDEIYAKSKCVEKNESG